MTLGFGLGPTSLHSLHDPQRHIAPKGAICLETKLPWDPPCTAMCQLPQCLWSRSCSDSRAELPLVGRMLCVGRVSPSSLEPGISCLPVATSSLWGCVQTAAPSWILTRESTSQPLQEQINVVERGRSLSPSCLCCYL